jgi:hypothetical protein
MRGRNDHSANGVDSIYLYLGVARSRRAGERSRTFAMGVALKSAEPKVCSFTVKMGPPLLIEAPKKHFDAFVEIARVESTEVEL